LKIIKHFREWTGREGEGGRGREIRREGKGRG